MDELEKYRCFVSRIWASSYWLMPYPNNKPCQNSASFVRQKLKCLHTCAHEISCTLQWENMWLYVYGRRQGGILWNCSLRPPNKINRKVFHFASDRLKNKCSIIISDKAESSDFLIPKLIDTCDTGVSCPAWTVCACRLCISASEKKVKASKRWNICYRHT